MSAPEQQAQENSGRPPRRVRRAGVWLVLALGLVAAAVWLLGGNAAPAGSAAKDGPTAVAPPGRDHEVGFEAPAPAGRDTDPTGALPEATPAAAVPLEGDSAKGGRLIRGVALRASDSSPVSSAMVFALQRDDATNSETELAHALTGTNGEFSVTAAGGANAFRVLVPSARGRSGEDIRQGTVVPVRVERASGDAAGSAVRLWLYTGWRLDVRILDRAGHPRAGVLVQAGGRSATSDAQGRCTILDLPDGDASVELGLPKLPEAKALTQLVAAPEAGQFRAEVDLTVP